MKVLVCGSREFEDYELLRTTLEELPFEITEIIEGEARGADKLAAQYALERGIKCTPFPADWDVHGKSAGPIRNLQMLDYGPEYVVAFMRHDSVGTRHMVDIAGRAGIPVKIVDVLSENSNEKQS